MNAQNIDLLLSIAGFKILNLIFAEYQADLDRYQLSKL